MAWGKRNPSRIPRKRNPQAKPGCTPAVAAATAPASAPNGACPKTHISLFKANAFSPRKKIFPKDKIHPWGKNPSCLSISLIGLCHLSIWPLFTTLFFLPLLPYGRVKERCKKTSRKFQRRIIPKSLTRRVSRSSEIQPPIGCRSDEIKRRNQVGEQRSPELEFWRDCRKRTRRRGFEWGWKMKKSDFRARLGNRALFIAAKKKCSFERKECKVFRGESKDNRSLLGAWFGSPVSQVIDFEELIEMAAAISEQGWPIGGRGCPLVVCKKKGTFWRKRSRESRFGVSISSKCARRRVEGDHRSIFRLVQGDQCLKE